MKPIFGNVLKFPWARVIRTPAMVEELIRFDTDPKAFAIRRQIKLHGYPKQVIKKGVSYNE